MSENELKFSRAIGTVLVVVFAVRGGQFIADGLTEKTGLNAILWVLGGGILLLTAITCAQYASGKKVILVKDREEVEKTDND